MFKQLVLAVATLAATMGLAMAQVDVNKADQAALDSVKGIGPATSKAIIDERAKGPYKDWSDFETRVKGIGPKSAVSIPGTAKPRNSFTPRFRRIGKRGSRNR